MLKFILKILVVSILSFLIINSVNAQETGFLKFDFNTDSIVVVIDRDIETKRTVLSGDSLELPAGTHIIEAYPPLDSRIITRRFIYRDSTRTINYNFNVNLSKKVIQGNLGSEQYFNSNLMLMVDHDSEIYHLGELVGIGFTKLNSPFKQIELEIVNPDFGSKTIDFSIKQGVSVYEHYRRPGELMASTLALVPGASQIYKRQHLKGLGFSVATTSLLVFGISKSLEYSEEKDNFYSLRKQYNDAIDEEEAFILGNLTERQQDVVTKLDNQRRFLLGGTLLIYAYNIFDAFTSSPEGGYYKKRTLEFYLSQEEGAYGYTNQATLQVNFGTK